MIKAIITSDWHIGNNFHGYDRLEDHQDYFRQLSELIKDEQPDALFVCGDIFDNANPSAVSQELYFSTLNRLTEENPRLQVTIISGNHDSASRMEAPSPFLTQRHIHVIGTVQWNDGRINYARHILPVHSLKSPSETLICLAVPYLRDGDYPKEDSYGKSVSAFISECLKEADRTYGHTLPKVLLAHLYATGSEIAEGSSERIIVGGSEQVDASGWNPEIVYTALGHIHRRQRVSGRENMRYCGSALPMSFTERNYKHGADILTVNADGTFRLESRDFRLLHPLLSFPEKALPWEELKQEISRLPSINDPAAPEYYLQLNVFIESTDPSLTTKVEEALKDRKVKLCKIQPFYPHMTEDDDLLDIQSLDTLRNLEPIDMLKKIYQNKKHCEMRKELLPLVKQAIKEAIEEKEGQA